MFQGAAPWPTPDPDPKPKPKVQRQVKALLRGPAYADTHVGPWQCEAGDGCLVRGPEAQVTAAQAKLKAEGYVVTPLHNFTALGLGFTVFAHPEPGGYWRGRR